MIRPSILYLGIEGVLLREATDDAVEPGTFEFVPGAEMFLKWAATVFDCRWLTSLNADGGDDQIRCAFSKAARASWSTEDIDLLFELVRPTYWEDVMVEAIELDGDFYWITNEVDEASRRVLQRRGVIGRLKTIVPENGIDELAWLQCELPAR